MTTTKHPARKPARPATHRTVRVAVTFEVDVDDWALDYRLPATASAVRADFRQWLAGCHDGVTVVAR